MNYCKVTWENLPKFHALFLFLMDLIDPEVPELDLSDTVCACEYVFYNVFFVATEYIILSFFTRCVYFE